MNSINKTPKVSVLMPAYNAEKYVGEAIESILNQTFTDFEFIIIDDCSNDGTWKIIQEYSSLDNRIVCIKNETNSKICTTLNRGIDISKGKYIVRMDADDWSYPNRLEKQVIFMDNHPEVVISGGTMEVCDENLVVLNLRKYNLSDEDVREKLFLYSPFCHASTIITTNILKKAGNYNKDLFDAEDYDLYFRLGRLGKLGNIPDILYKMRTNKNGVSHTRAKRQELLTLYIRAKAVLEYGYKIKASSIIYSLFQCLSMFLIPFSVKKWIFNKIR